MASLLNMRAVNAAFKKRRARVRAALKAREQPPPEDVVVPLPPPTDTEAASLRALNKKLRDDLASTPVKTDSGWRKISVGVDSSAEFAEAVRRFREQLSAKFKASMAREMARPAVVESTNEEILRDLKGLAINFIPQYTEPFKGPYIPTYPSDTPVDSSFLCGDKTPPQNKNVYEEDRDFPDEFPPGNEYEDPYAHGDTE